MSAEHINGWVVLAVSVEPGYELDPKTYEFENDHAYFEDYGGDIAFVSTEDALTFEDALRNLGRMEEMERGGGRQD